MSIPNSPLHKIGQAFLSAFTNLSASEHLALRADDCLHVFAPASVGITEAKTNAVFGSHVTSLGRVLAHFPVTAKEMFVNEAGRQVTIWATGVPEFREEAKGGDDDDDDDDGGGDWDYVGEYIFILDVDERGKIKRIIEFLDSKNTMVLLGMVRKARENVAAFAASDGK
ncbi:hypothetical protein K504DRAFT_458108 [Pleomassaria siparia CBS 279.74]|uniref:SnoaL-like domain-containing protein n=1 Tax=Pleomassaria siparia CBS 279.74 TaxID=1314801 RepID=A0A6G1K576_9PLEO|nr:hypothetical protein K504DRAFT_458108 [Pleomassaria siparia CBS 279.74]